MSESSLLVTVCARGGSKGLPGKNIRPFLGMPLIGVTIEQARRWGRARRIAVSTDSPEIARVAREFGAEVPFVRPAELAGDTIGKVPVITHCLRQSEAVFGERYEAVVDLDVTSPVRSVEDLENGYRTFESTGADVCLSVVPARKSPYFNILERDGQGRVSLSKPLPTAVLSRQSAPKVWEANASIYFYRRDFLMKDPRSIWDGKLEMFEMPRTSAFDIDEETDFHVAEMMMALMKEERKKT